LRYDFGEVGRSGGAKKTERQWFDFFVEADAEQKTSRGNRRPQASPFTSRLAIAKKGALRPEVFRAAQALRA
jgi:hypothetical protein